MDDEAKRCWADIAPKLERMGVLTEIDGNALTAYCRTWSRWVRAEQFIEENGESHAIYDGGSGAGRVIRSYRAFPQVAISRNLVAIMQRYEAKFGLSPADRTSIAVDRPKEKVGIERFIDTG